MKWKRTAEHQLNNNNKSSNDNGSQQQYASQHFWQLIRISKLTRANTVEWKLFCASRENLSVFCVCVRMLSMLIEITTGFVWCV